MLIPFADLLFFRRKITGIIHIGAHELEELNSYINKNIRKIIWIEPNPYKHKFIEDKLKTFDEMYLGKFAAGSSEEEIYLNIANNGMSSSLLELGTHKKYYPQIDYVSKVKVFQKPLDKWLNINIRNNEKYNFLNIDIQGYELEALKGLVEQLNFVDFIYIEVNFEEIYKDCPNIKNIDIFLSKSNFHRVGTVRTRFGWGDAIYVKKFILINKIYYQFYLRFLNFINFLIKSLKKIFIEKKLYKIKSFLLRIIYKKD